MPVPLTLYFNPHSRGVIAKWILDEADASYEIEPIDFGKQEHKAPSYMKINPAGKVPALVDGQVRIFENAAICLYVAEKFPQAQLAPPIGSPDRGRYLSLMVYSTAQIEPAMGDNMLKMQTAAARGWTDLEAVKDAVEYELGYGPYLLGHQFTAADVMVGSMFIWFRMAGGRINRPKLERYVDRLLARPKGIKFS